MTFCVGTYEHQLAQLGHVIATVVGRRFRCWQCERGELILTREINAEGMAKPAAFVCDSCESAIGVYPDQGGGVQPSLKMNMKGKGFGADTVGDPSDGRWR